jgi:aldose 1-epimerase
MCLCGSNLKLYPGIDKNSTSLSMSTIIKILFGEYEGNDIYRFTLQNSKGNSIAVINYGGTLISWMVNGKNIVAGFNNLEDYVKNDSYFGCIAGRYANRIANGRFPINGTVCHLNCNNGSNHLHGGYRGFDKVVWDAKINEPENTVLSLHYLSKDGEEGYPGNLSVRVDYSYTDDDELIIGYFAETDKATPVNLTSHSYFNLTGDMSKTILGHSLLINADHYTPVNMNQIPTGELSRVDETAFDLREPVSLSGIIEKVAGGYDHNFALNKSGDGFSFAAMLVSPENDMQLSVFTTEPGIQLYTGNLLDGRFINRDGSQINRHSALCLETQHFPDSPNQANFPSCILMPGKKYFSKTVFKVTEG